MPRRLSYQLYSSRNHGPLAATLSMLAKLGYKEVEGYGGVYEDVAAMRRLLDRNGLLMPTGHFSIEMMEGKQAAAQRIARSLGISTLVVPYLDADKRPTSAAGWKAFGKRLNAIARSYRAEGLAVAWHNHDFEFQRLRDGSVPHEVMFDAAPQLDWEIDVAWVARGKSDPLKWIKRYGSIIIAAHVKDIAPKGRNADEDGWADVGQGTLNWKKLTAALAQTRCMHLIVEHDNPKDDARFARRSIAACKSF